MIPCPNWPSPTPPLELVVTIWGTLIAVPAIVGAVYVVKRRQHERYLERTAQRYPFMEDHV